MTQERFSEYYTRKWNVLLEFQQANCICYAVSLKTVNTNHKKPMKRLSCTVNKSVQKNMMYYSEVLHCIAILMIL